MRKEIVQISANEFTKAYDWDGIEIFVSKAYDEDSDKHFLISSIKEIPQLKVQRIQFPIVFESERERNEGFDEFNEGSAMNLIDQLIAQIKENQKTQAAISAEEKENDDNINTGKGGIVRSIGKN